MSKVKRMQTKQLVTPKSGLERVFDNLTTEFGLQTIQDFFSGQAVVKSIEAVGENYNLNYILSRCFDEKGNLRYINNINLINGKTKIDISDDEGDSTIIYTTPHYKVTQTKRMFTILSERIDDIAAKLTVGNWRHDNNETLAYKFAKTNITSEVYEFLKGYIAYITPKK